jgi:hypothetical protein
LAFVARWLNALSISERAPTTRAAVGSIGARFAQSFTALAGSEPLPDVLVEAVFVAFAAGVGRGIETAEADAASDELDVGEAPQAFKEKTAENSTDRVLVYFADNFDSVFFNEDFLTTTGHIHRLSLHILSSKVRYLEDLQGLASRTDINHQEVAKGNPFGANQAKTQF